MAARCRYLWLTVAMLTLCVGCASLRHATPWPSSTSSPAKLIPVPSSRPTEFAELQQVSDRDADNKEQVHDAQMNRSNGVRLISLKEVLPSEADSADQSLTSAAAIEEEKGPPKPSKSDSSVPTPIFESAERLPPPKSSPPPREMPTVEGQRLRLLPGESAVERAVALAQMLEASQAENRVLQDRIRSLEVQVQEADRIREDERQVAAQAAADATRYRLRMEALHEEVAALRERLRRAERQDVETLREIITILERLIQDDSPPRPASQ